MACWLGASNYSKEKLGVGKINFDYLTQEELDMVCYKDMTFCPHHESCEDGEDCERALTDQVKKDAEKWWGRPGAPIAQADFREASCYKGKFFYNPENE